ncbi:MAG: sugar ABC transporter permease [Clostridia bacterium]|nr:sugar ABC transporter permease [Clostridia bacterium]
MMEKEIAAPCLQGAMPPNKKLIRKSKHRKGRTLFIVCILAIPILNWLVFWLYVNISSIFLAFQELDPWTGTEKWSLGNFEKFWEHISGDGDLPLSLRNTGLYFLSGLLITMPLALFISYFISKKIFGYQFFRVIFYLPCIITPVILTSLYDQMLAPGGPIERLFSKLTWSYPEAGPLYKNGSIMPTMMIILYTILTGFGGDMLIFSGAMSRIPTEVYESAKLDGCGPIREVFTIVMPLIWSTISTKIVLLMSGVFAASGPIMLLVTENYETTTLSFWIFNSINSKDGSGDIHLVAMAGLCFTAIIIPIIFGVRALMEKFGDVEY